MQKNVQTTGQKTPYKYKKSRYSAKSPESEVGDRASSRKLSRLDSGIEASVALSRSDSETETQGQSDVCHSPTEDDVFDQRTTIKAKHFANTLSKIPRAKLARQASKINHHKDR
jgi:hypothetical protein